MIHAAILTFALILDAIFGEPEAVWSRVPHPAVLMGRAVGWCDRMMNRGRSPLIMGAIALDALVTLAALIGWAVAALGWPFELIAAAILLAQKSLVDHVAAVAEGLSHSLDDGKSAVAMIVGRDTADMDEPAVARAAIESAAENLSDGIIAPAFWFLIGGLPLMLAYKMVNTADSMIGHRTPRYEQFGKAAARLDDLMNWIPARITAALILITSGAWRLSQRVRRDAPLHRSPNAGWPEAAMAVSLDVALSGPRSYHGETRDYPFVNPEGDHLIGAPEIDRATGLLWRAWAGGLALTLILSVV